MTDTIDAKKMSLDELASLEAAERALLKAGRGKSFDPDIFEAVAKNEVAKLRKVQ